MYILKYYYLHAWGHSPLIPLGTLCGISNKTHCPFCRLIRKTLAFEDSGFQALKENLPIIRCFLTSDTQYNLYSTRIRKILVGGNLLHEAMTIRKPWASLGIHQILQNGERPPEQKLNESCLVEEQINIELVKSWLQLCNQQHQSMKQMPDLHFHDITHDNVHNTATLIQESCQPVPLSKNSLGLTLIDVQIGCLVSTTHDVRYFASSYVWVDRNPFKTRKKSRATELYTPGAITAENSDIPQIIRDAIEFVGKIGERYLWINSLCIIQDSTSEKMEQISNMGNIYSRAYITLVAAFGESCHTGFPGVRAKSRKTIQHVEQIGDMLLANQLQPLYRILRDSTWSTRGWTYQEHELSKRCLIFIEHLLYFSCNHMVVQEDSGLRDVSLRRERADRIRLERYPIWACYRSAVKNFSKRNFTFDADVINAFRGIAALLQPASKCDFLHGLPETELDVALLWQPKSPIRRRVDKLTGEPLFPSWSWAGWVGEVGYIWTKHLLDDISWVRWQVQLAGKTEYFSSNQLRMPQAEHGVTWRCVEYTHQPGIPYYYQPEHPGIWCLHPVAVKDTCPPRLLLLPGAHDLRFKAYTAMLRLEVKSHIIDPFDYDPLSNCKTSRHVCCPAQIISGDGFVAGTIYIPTHLVGTIASGRHELVCLSRRRGDEASRTDPYAIYDEYEDARAYAGPIDNVEEVPYRLTLYPSQTDIRRTNDKYDHSRYNKNKPWPLFNVMLIERKVNVAFRVALGLFTSLHFCKQRP
jgi:hypothetical protein